MVRTGTDILGDSDALRESIKPSEPPKSNPLAVMAIAGGPVSVIWHSTLVRLWFVPTADGL